MLMNRQSTHVSCFVLSLSSDPGFNKLHWSKLFSPVLQLCSRKWIALFPEIVFEIFKVQMFQGSSLFLNQSS